MKAILACVDESDPTPQVVDAAADLAKGLGARLYLLRVASPLASVLAEEGLADGAFVAERLRGGRENLEMQRQRARRRGADATTLLVEAGNPAAAIVQEARRLGADLLVMGTHGHGPLYQLMLGSTTEGVLRKAPCPVLVVPASKQTVVIAPAGATPAAERM